MGGRVHLKLTPPTEFKLNPPNADTCHHVFLRKSQTFLFLSFSAQHLMWSDNERVHVCVCACVRGGRGLMHEAY